ncbi:hypothetical protein EIP86_009458 [Pleurotus ostreatoroseus]|nr:hypothetical protein EIP86_009458 [Pleurotus ostreatoroseus]
MPSQIVHRILGFLKPRNEYLDAYYDDEWQTDLLACSQVSKSWRKLALKYLFTSLVLRFEGCDPSLEYDQKMGTYSPDTKTLRRFERFLKDFPGGLASVTQHLSLKMVRPSGGYSSYLDPTALSFMSLLKALPALRTLRLRDVCLNSLFGTTPALFEYTSPVALESLYIHYSQRRVRPSQLMHLLSCFGTILELHLEDFKPDVIACDELVMEPPLHTLTFQMSTHERFHNPDHPNNHAVVRQIGHAIRSIRNSPPKVVELDFYVGQRLSSALEFPRRNDGARHLAVRKTVQFDDKENLPPHGLDSEGQETKGILKRKYGDQEFETHPKRACVDKTFDKGKGRATVEERQGAREGHQDSYQGMTVDRTHEEPVVVLEVPRSPAYAKMTPLKSLAVSLQQLGTHGLSNLRITLYTSAENLDAALRDERFLTHIFRKVIAEGLVDVDIHCIVVDE